MRFNPLALGCALSLSVITTSAFAPDQAFSQSRDFGAQSITLDDNAGHRLKIMAPTSGWPSTGIFEWTLPFPPQGVAAGFVGQGNADNKYLTWDLINGYWKAAPSLPGVLGTGTPSALTKWSITGDALTSTSLVEDANVLTMTGNSLLITGTIGSTPASGEGTRLMWIPDLSAFRAGAVTGEQWDAANIGSLSFAGGHNTTASGVNSTSLGDGSTASGDYSVAIGTGATASGVGSLALGEGTIASGGNATAMGINTIASGVRSTAMGLGTEASGSNSVAMGAGATATAPGAVGMGSGDATGFLSTASGQSTASGNYSTASGDASVASGISSTAFGRISTASGFASVALGEVATASGDFSLGLGIGAYAIAEGAVAIGQNEASGIYSAALGLNTTASGAKAIAIGVSSEATGTNSLALGTATVASGTSAMSMGSGSEASAFNSIAIGHSVTADGINSTAMGTHASSGAFQGGFIFGDNSGIADVVPLADNQFVVRADGGYRLYTNAATSAGVLMNSGDNSWSSISDSNRKTNRLNINGDEVLNKLSNIWLGSWNYKSQDKTTRHYGPMAQEFFAAFGNDGVGIIGNDTTLATADVDGVTLIAVKALEERTSHLQAENQELNERVAMLEALLRKMATSTSQDAMIMKALLVK